MVRQLGGRVGDITMTILGTPKFQLDEKVLVFLQVSSPPYYRVIGLSQGKFNIIIDSENKKSYAKRDLSDLKLLIRGEKDSYIEKQKVQEERLPLDDLLKEIKFHLDS
jgi:hypothetical protein